MRCGVIWAGMPKNPDDTHIPAHLTPDELKEFLAIATPLEWSKKKLAERIIRGFLKLDAKTKEKILALGKKENPN